MSEGPFSYCFWRSGRRDRLSSALRASRSPSSTSARRALGGVRGERQRRAQADADPAGEGYIERELPKIGEVGGGFGVLPGSRPRAPPRHDTIASEGNSARFAPTSVMTIGDPTLFRSMRVRSTPRGATAPCGGAARRASEQALFDARRSAAAVRAELDGLDRGQLGEEPRLPARALPRGHLAVSAGIQFCKCKSRD